MNRFIRTLWQRLKRVVESFNQIRKTFGLVQALAVTLWGYRNPWYRNNHVLGAEVDRIAGAYLDENIPGVTLMDAIRYATDDLRRRGHLNVLEQDGRDRKVGK